MQSAVTSYIETATVTANAGDVKVKARDNVSISAFGELNVTAAGGNAFGGQGTVVAGGGQLATNLVLASAVATINASDITANKSAGLGATDGNIIVSADDAALIDARLHSASSTGSEGGSIALAFNTVGWKPTNALFAAVDALLQDPLISEAFDGVQPAQAKAIITNSDIDADRDVSVTATNNSAINATMSNAAETKASALYGAEGKGFGVILASNKVNSETIAYIDNGNDALLTVTAGGDLTVSADNKAAITSNTKMVASTVTSNDGGAAIIQETLNDLYDADYDSKPDIGIDTKIRDIKYGDRIRLADDYAAEEFDTEPEFPGTTRFEDLKVGDEVKIADVDGWDDSNGNIGSIYRYVGAADAPHTDLAAIDYADNPDWLEVGGDHGAVYIYMGTADTGAALDLNAQNYADLGFWKKAPEFEHHPAGHQCHSVERHRGRRDLRRQRRAQSGAERGRSSGLQFSADWQRHDQYPQPERPGSSQAGAVER